MMRNDKKPWLPIEMNGGEYSLLVVAWSERSRDGKIMMNMFDSDDPAHLELMDAFMQDCIVNLLGCHETNEDGNRLEYFSQVGPHDEIDDLEKKAAHIMATKPGNVSAIFQDLHTMLDR